MATSPLTASLLASQNADPTALMLNPQIQLAQRMISEGTDSSPIRSPWQGVARLAQILAGNSIQNKALSGAAGMYTQAAEDAAKTVPEGTAMWKALKSQNPLIRSQALQVYNKGLLQLSEPKETSPGTQVVIPGATGGPVATNTNPMSKEFQMAADAGNNPRMAATVGPLQASLEKYINDARNTSRLQFDPKIAGATAMAEVPGKVAQAGGVARAESPYKLTETRSGAIIPNSAIPGIGNPVPAPAPQAAAPPQIQPAVPAASQAPPGAPVGGGAQPGAAPPGPAVQGAPPPQQFGGGVRALPGGAGLMAPSQDTFKPMIDEDTKEVATDREKAILGQNDQATVTAIRDFLPKVKTGWTAPLKLQAGAILQAAGVDPTEIKNLTSIDPANGQVLQKKMLELSMGAARTMGAREPGSVISMFKSAYPSLETTPEAINLQSNALYMDRQRQQKMASAKTNYLNQSVNDLQATGEYRGLKGFNENFNQSDNPNDYLRAAEAMSGAKWSPWSKITDPAQQHQIISLIPKGTQFVGPDGNAYVRQ